MFRYIYLFISYTYIFEISLKQAQLLIPEKKNEMQGPRTSYNLQTTQIFKPTKEKGLESEVLG